jgi:hypothetical protein
MATDTYSEYVLLVAFSRQKCLKEHAAVLRYTCISSLTALISTSLDNRGQQPLSKNSEKGKNFKSNF